MNRTKAEQYLSRFIELNFSIEEFGDTEWYYGESPKKEYMVHVILEDDKDLDNPKNVWYDRVRIWNTKFGNQIEVPILEELTLSQLDISSLKCHECGQIVTNFKQMQIVSFDEAVCKACIATKK